MIIHDCPQRGNVWRALRAGRITGTSMKTMANGTEAGIEKLCQRVADERKNGYAAKEGFTSAAMQRGIELEAEAREMFEIAYRRKVTGVGFWEMDDLIGCSPDGLFDYGGGVYGGGVEIKCPSRKIHERYLSEGRKAWQGSYWWQVVGSMWATGRDYWYFVSYHPDLPAWERLYVDAVHRMYLPNDVYSKLDAGAAYCRKRIAEIEENNDE